MPELSSSCPMTIFNIDTAVNRRRENMKVPASLTWQKTGLSPVSKSKIDHPPLRRTQGTFPPLSQRPPAVRWNALSTWWNEMYNQRYTFEITSFWQACQGQDDNESIRSHMKAPSFYWDHKGSKAHTMSFPNQQLVQIPPFTNEPVSTPLQALRGRSKTCARAFENLLTSQDSRICHDHPSMLPEFCLLPISFWWLF